MEQANKIISPEKFFSQYTLEDWAIIDVRSPMEYAAGHIPESMSMPLFMDDERSQIGITYKTEGRNAAIKLGLKIVGPKLAQYICAAESLAHGKKILLHCWRGGMRSKSMAWLLQLAGYEIAILEGGYKAFRIYQRNELIRRDYKFIVLGGKTGSGKTNLLRLLKNRGEQVLNLEELSNHKGSAFGAIGQKPQNANEQFENNLYKSLFSFDPTKCVWVENESRKIGKNYIPDELWFCFKKYPLINLEICFDQRLQNLLEDYAMHDSKLLIDSFRKLRKRIGFVKEQKAIDFILLKNYSEAAKIALEYYDSCYIFGLENNPSPKIINLPIIEYNPEKILDLLLDIKNNI